MERDLEIVETKTRSKYNYTVENQENTYQGVPTGLVYEIHSSYRTGRSTTESLYSISAAALPDSLKRIWSEVRKLGSPYNFICRVKLFSLNMRNLMRNIDLKINDIKNAQKKGMICSLSS